MCNALYYRALQAAEGAKGARVPFVHVPASGPSPGCAQAFCAALAEWLAARSGGFV